MEDLCFTLHFHFRRGFPSKLFSSDSLLRFPFIRLICHTARRFYSQSQLSPQAAPRALNIYQILKAGKIILFAEQMFVRNLLSHIFKRKYYTREGIDYVFCVKVTFQTTEQCFQYTFHGNNLLKIESTSLKIIFFSLFSNTKYLNSNLRHRINDDLLICLWSRG